jgi:two-component system, NtrC family, response regulator AtoC
VLSLAIFTNAVQCARLQLLDAIMNQILAVGSERALLESVKSRFVERGYNFLIADSGKECVERFRELGADVVMVCLPLFGSAGGDLIRGIRALDPRVSIVVTGKDAQIACASDAFQFGAIEYLSDPALEMNDLLAAVGGALGARRGDMQLRYLKQREAHGSTWDSLIGSSSAMKELVDNVRRVIDRTTRGAPPTILLRGETGTGKGLLAKCIHYNSARRNQTFVELNCAAIPPTLLESELFGHERGAFTDARTSRPGLFETAHGGTLFLDEIAGLTLDLQVKILTALEEKRIRRIGGRESIYVDAQIIAASHNDLHERVRAKTFREDLYHRLNVVSFTLPPLRKRGEDKVVLARAFIERACREYGLPARTLTEDAEDYIREYAWPGNVREMRNQLERIVLLSTDEVIDGSHFYDRTSLPPPSAPPSMRAQAPSDLRIGKSFAMSIPDEGVGLDEVERELIVHAMRRLDGNVSRAAKFLKVSRQTLMYRLKRHGLE